MSQSLCVIQCVFVCRREGLTLCYMPPPLSLPWSRLGSRLWSPLSWLEVWLAHFPAPTHSFHCIVSDGKKTISLGRHRHHNKPRESVRPGSIPTPWPCLIVVKLQHWVTGSVHYRHHHRHGEYKQKENGAGTLHICYCYSRLLTEHPAQTLESSTLAHFMTRIWLEPCAWTSSNSCTNV